MEPIVLDFFRISSAAQNQNEQNSKNDHFHFERPKNFDIQLIIYGVDNIDISTSTDIDNLSPQIWRIKQIFPKKLRNGADLEPKLIRNPSRFETRTD